MNKKTKCRKQFVADTVAAFGKRWMMIGAVVFAFAVSSTNLQVVSGLA